MMCGKKLFFGKVLHEFYTMCLNSDFGFGFGAFEGMQSNNAKYMNICLFLRLHACILQFGYVILIYFLENEVIFLSEESTGEH